MIIHTMWIGSEIPIKYHSNLDKFRMLNPGFQHMHWGENDIISIFKYFNLIELYNSMPSFITKFNLAKYAILDKFGGIFTDLDIQWKKSFIEIMNDQEFNDIDILLTHPVDTAHYYINDQAVNLLDDPFIIARPNLLSQCLDFRFKRELRIDPETKAVHKAEPIGPFLLTEWIYANQIKHRAFSQTAFLSLNGFYGYHEQLDLWNK